MGSSSIETLRLSPYKEMAGDKKEKKEKGRGYGIAKKYEGASLAL